MTEEECIELICMGSKPADVGCTVLYRLMAKRMLRFFVLNGASGQEAEDLLQETFIKVFEKATTYSGNGSAKSWIWQIARNILTDQFRNRGRIAAHQVIFDDDDSWSQLLEATPGPDPVNDDEESMRDCVQRGISAYGMQMPDRAYVITLYMEGSAIAEIADEIGRSIKATKQYLFQCRKKLKPFIEDCRQYMDT